MERRFLFRPSSSLVTTPTELSESPQIHEGLLLGEQSTYNLTVWRVRVTVVALESNNTFLYCCASVAVSNIHIECNNESSFCFWVTVIWWKFRVVGKNKTQQTFEKLSAKKLHNKRRPTVAELTRAGGRTDRHGEANRHFSRLARMLLIKFMIGCVVVGEVSSWPLVTDVRVRCKAGSYGICGGRSDAGKRKPVIII